MQQKYTLYYKVMEQLKDDILNGEYPLGGLIPTENELEKEFSVSKITIRKAIELLEQDGYVKKKSGYGTTVISNNIYNKLSKGAPFSSIIHSQNLTLNKKHYPMEKIKLESDDEMAKYFGSAAVQINRMLSLDETPYIFMQHFLPKKVKIERTIDDDDFSVYMFLYRNKLVINRFEDFFYVAYATGEIAEALHVADNTPMLGRKRITYNDEDAIIEVSLSYYNSAVHPYQINYSI